MNIGKVILNIFHGILLCSVVAVILGVCMLIVVGSEESERIESTRQVILTCTVKSNIDGVITLNDECDLVVIGEE